MDFPQKKSRQNERERDGEYTKINLYLKFN